VDPCHHGMARPRVADGGDSLQIWRAVAESEQWLFLQGAFGRGASKFSP